MCEWVSWQWELCNLGSLVVLVIFRMLSTAVLQCHNSRCQTKPPPYPLETKKTLSTNETRAFVNVRSVVATLANLSKVELQARAAFEEESLRAKAEAVWRQLAFKCIPFGTVPF